MKARQFTPTEFSTVEDKQKFVRQFKKFVEGGFKRSQFPKWFYTRLSMTFGHIAHYNQNGFYDVFFKNRGWPHSFISHTLRHGCYGDPAYTYSDVEKYLIMWLQNYIEEGRK